MTAAEARAAAPTRPDAVVDAAREPRWGCVEGVRRGPHSWRGWASPRSGVQGDATFRDKTRVIATLGTMPRMASRSRANCAPVNVSMRVLRETFLSTFKAAIQEGGALSVMPSYNEIDGVPSHANRWLIEDVLRSEWGFLGFTVSDYFAVRELQESSTNATSHHVARDGKHAAAIAVIAGVDIELPVLTVTPTWSSWSGHDP
jgi:beta-glucosidase